MYMPKKRRGLFGAPTSQSPDYEVGLGHQMPADIQAKKSGGFLGKGGAGRAIAGTIGDVLLQRNGMAPIYAPTMQAQQERQTEAAQQAAALRQKSMDREAGFQDWQRKQQWERDNPKPVNNDTVADYEFIKENLGGDAAEEFLKNKANPPQYRQGPDGRFYRIDAGSSAPSPPTVIGAQLPQGWKVDGGPQQSSAGGFPEASY